MKSMRLIAPALIAVSLLVVSLAWAQGGNPPASTKESGQTSGYGQTAAEQTAARHDRMHDRLEWLSKELNLTDGQKEKLKPILQDEGKQMGAVHDDSSLTPDQKRDKVKQIRETSRPQIQAVLTPEQQEKFKNLKEEARERRQGKDEMKH
jgi:protein CpxP